MSYISKEKNIDDEKNILYVGKANKKNALLKENNNKFI